ncbi:MAG: nickel pincer cofactor biosynthesis protein LarB [Candidatus Hydrogenedentes bacterium]|nr:nickel pincer cofactor biosynthesis protein LarB [Candidatus Hydrogenedentota bacterium]
MDSDRLRELMDQVASGDVPAQEALQRMRALPFEDLGYAKIDHHRPLRKGYPETIFCQGKEPHHVVEIVARMRAHGSNVLGTRADATTMAAVMAAHPDAVEHSAARAFTIMVDPPDPCAGVIAVVSAGTTDIPVAEEAAVTCESMGNTVSRIFDVGVAGIHRLFKQRERLDEANVVIVCAGMEGALPSVVGGLVEAPVIAVPTSVGYGASLGGIAALLGMLNSCATGLTVVNIDNGFGAGVAASTINRLANGKRIT